MDDLQRTWQQRYDALQMEETKSFEKLRQENARRHQQLLELLTALTPNLQVVHIPLVSIEGQPVTQEKPSSSIPLTQNNARKKVLGIQAPMEKKQPLQYTLYRKLDFPQSSEKNSKTWFENSTVQALIKEKEQIPIPTSANKRVSALINSGTEQPTAAKGVEQQHQEYLPRETDKKLEMRSGSSVSQPKESLELHTAELPPPKAAYIVPTPSRVQSPPPEATYTVTSPRLEGSNGKDNVIPSPARANKGKEQKVLELEGNPNSSELYLIFSSNCGLKERLKPGVGKLEQKHPDYLQMEDNPARVADLRVQVLIQNSSSIKAGRVCIFENGYKELGTTLEMPHPCSLSLAYEQAKLKESIEVCIVLLGVKRYASIEKVVKAYDEISNKWHLSVDLPTTIEFIEMRYAFELLTNPVWKRDYDHFGLDEQLHVFQRVKKQYENEDFSKIKLPLLSESSFSLDDNAFNILTREKFIYAIEKGKPLLIQVYSTGSPRYAQFTKDYSSFLSLGLVLWREEDSQFWWNLFGVESAPAYVFLKGPGVKPQWILVVMQEAIRVLEVTVSSGIV